MLRPLALAALCLSSVSSFANAAKDEPSDADSAPARPTLDVKAAASFPSSEIFGVKLVNGQPTQAVLDFTNNEADPVKVVFVGGSLWSNQYQGGPQIVRNLTTQRMNVDIPSEATASLSYFFVTEMVPQELTLNLAAVVADENGTPYTILAYNETVSVVEPDTSIFDPQIIFLYLFLLAAFVGTIYFIYSTWITTLFPQKRGKGKGGERARKSLGGGSKAIDPNDQVSVIGADGPAVTSNAKAYDESWIPAHHINKPQARKSAGKGKSKAKAAE